MKKSAYPKKRQQRKARHSLRWQRLLAAAIVIGGTHARAADTNSPPMSPQDFFEGGTNTYTDWIEMGGGAFVTGGNRAQAQENQHLANGAFGGIEDLHVQGNAFTNTVFTLDGHGIYDQHDYSVGMGLKRDDLGFVHVDFENFRTWFNGAGGYYPPTGTQYNLGNDALALDSGKISLEAGLTKDNLPQITFKYTHRYREGDESSTIWGPVHPDPLNSPATVQGLEPSYYHIDEKIDTFGLDVKKQIKGTDVDLGFTYEHGSLNDTLYTTQYPLEPIQSDETQKQGTTYDLFSGNASTGTWLKKNLFLSTGLMFSDLENNFSGSQIYGDSFGVGYSPAAPNPSYGYYNLNGDSHLQEYVMDVNLMAIPIKTFTITPAIRVEKENWDAESSGLGTLLNFAPEAFNSQSSRDDLDVCESLDARYVGVTNWVFTARGEWDEGSGDLNQYGGLTQVNGIGPAPLAPAVVTDDDRLFQKYTAGVRWYPLYRLAIDAGGYYKNDRWDYSNNTFNPGDYPGFIALQSFETYDGNFRLTYRPLQNVSLTSRYEYQLSTIDTAPNGATQLPEVQASKMTSHILAEDVSWVPWSRLSLQAGFDYVLSETKTPASGDTQAILNAENNYWMVNGSANFVVDDKTDLNVTYYYYQADDYQNNSTFGVPYGAGEQEQGVTASLTRRLTQHLRLSLKYGFTHYTDATSGGFNDFNAHVIFSSIQYRF
jgi:hypothetical protein